MHWLMKNKVRQRLEMLKPLSAQAMAQAGKIEWFTTAEYLPLEQAWRGPFKPFQVGTSWGAGGADEKAYFKLTFSLPAECKGKKTLLRVRSGGEGACYRADGNPWQGLDWIRNDLLLRESAEGTEAFELLLEVIPSRSYWAAFDGPVKFEQADIVCENKTIARAAFLAEMCLNLAEALGDESLRAERLWQALDESLDAFPWGSAEIGDYEQPAEKAASLLVSLLKRRGEEGRLILDAMPHSHIDTAWLWPFSETVRKCGRTFSTVINYMKQYPHYRFIQSQASLYQFTKENYPPLYESIKQRAAEGRWEPTGAMWVEPDTNVPSGESLIRQILLGNGFFQREFGKRTKVLWLPDVFGYSASLPQILLRADVPYFITHKLGMNEDNRFPYAWFQWEGIDGSRALAHIQQCGYGDPFAPRSLLAAEKSRRIPEIDFATYMFGWGDGGGGPTENDIRAIELLEDVSGLPRTRLRPVEESFEEAAQANLPVWRGELYFENHRGTYTTQAAMKRLNRECELALRDAEMLASWEVLLGGEAQAKTFTPLWETVCVHQFHDVLPGSSRRMVYAEAIPTLMKTRDEARRLAEKSLERLTKPEKGKMTLANTLSWKRADLVHLPEDYKGDLAVQTVEGGKLALVEVPALGLFAAEVAAAEGLKADGRTLSNNWIRATFNEKGQLISLYDLERGREAVAEGEAANELRLHEDRPAPNRYGGGNDAWDLNIFYEKKYRVLEAQKVELTENGPIRATLRFTYCWEKGEIVQDVSLYAHSRRLDFRTHVVWNEDQRVLRAYFPVSVNSDYATYEIQFGHLDRPNHRNTSWEATKFEVCAHKWADLSEGGFGVALLNDCKYGHSALGNRISITLLRATTAPDPEADRGEHDFTYALLPHGEGFLEVVREAYALNVPLLAAQDRIPKQTFELPISAEHVALETMKPAEDGKGVILRLYDTLNQRGPTELTLPCSAQVMETNLMEDNEANLEAGSGRLRFNIKPFEIRTFRILPAG
jgi:alpha-mannosidase